MQWEGERERGREGGRERERGREGGRERGREREGGRERAQTQMLSLQYYNGEYTVSHTHPCLYVRLLSVTSELSK